MSARYEDFANQVIQYNCCNKATVNSHSNRKLKTSSGGIELEVTRESKGEFVPALIKKRYMNNISRHRKQDFADVRKVNDDVIYGAYTSIYVSASGSGHRANLVTRYTTGSKGTEPYTLRRDAPVLRAPGKR